MEQTREVIDAAIRAIRHTQGELSQIDKMGSVAERDLREAHQALEAAAIALLGLSGPQ